MSEDDMQDNMRKMYDNMRKMQENMRDDDPFSGEFQRLERLACDTIQVNYNPYILSHIMGIYVYIHIYILYVFYMSCHNPEKKTIC